MSFNITHHGPIPHMHHAHLPPHRHSPHVYHHDPKSSEKALDSAVQQLFKLYLPERADGPNMAPEPEPRRYPSPTIDAHYADGMNPRLHHHPRPHNAPVRPSGKAMIPMLQHRPTATTSWQGDNRETEYKQEVTMVQAEKVSTTSKMAPGARSNMPNVRGSISMDDGHNFHILNREARHRHQIPLSHNKALQRQSSPPGPFPPASHPINNLSFPTPSRSAGPLIGKPSSLPPSSSLHYESPRFEYKRLPPLEAEPEYHFDANQAQRGQEVVTRHARPPVTSLSPIRPQKLPWGPTGPPPMNSLMTLQHLQQHGLSPSNSFTTSANTASNGSSTNGASQPDWSKQQSLPVADQISPSPPDTRRRKHPPRHVRFYDVVTVIPPELSPVLANNHRGGSGGRQGRTIAPVAMELFSSTRSRDLTEVGMGVDLGKPAPEDDSEGSHEGEEEEEGEEETAAEAEAEDAELCEDADVQDDAMHRVVQEAEEDKVDGVLKYREQHGIVPAAPRLASTSSTELSTSVADDELYHDPKLLAMEMAEDGSGVGTGTKLGRLKNIGKRWFS